MCHDMLSDRMIQFELRMPNISKLCNLAAEVEACLEYAFQSRDLWTHISCSQIETPSIMSTYLLAMVFELIDAFMPSYKKDLHLLVPVGYTQPVVRNLME